MRTMNFYAFAAMVAGAGMFASCSQDDADPAADDPNAPVEVAFSGNIAEVSEVPFNGGTRVTGNNWDANDEIVTSMIPAEFTSPNPPGDKDPKDYVTIKNYKATTGGATSTFTSDDPLYFPADDNLMFFAALYPAWFGVDGAEMDITDQSDFSKLDVLLGTASGVYNKTWARTKVDGQYPKVNLDFVHRMAKVTVNVKAGEGITIGSEEKLSVTLKDLKSVCVWDIPSVTVLPTEDSPTADIAAQYKGNTFGAYKYEAIVIPGHYDGDEEKFVIAINSVDNEGQDNMYYWSNEGALTLNAGNSYIYNVTLKRTGVEVSASISKWTSVGEAY